MKFTMDVADAEFRDYLRRFKALSGKSWPEILRQQGRLLAVSFGISTQPYGTSEPEAFKAGLDRQIRRVFIAPGAIVPRLARTAGFRKNKTEEGEKSRLLKYENNPAALRKMLKDMTGGRVTLRARPDPAIHKAARDAKGRVPRRPAVTAYISNEESVARYVEKKQKLIGFAKSGWASCAKILGGTRGLPGWVTRNKGPGEVIDGSFHPEKPQIIIRNNVRYAGSLLPAGEMENAIRIQKEKFMKMVDYALKAAARTARR